MIAYYWLLWVLPLIDHPIWGANVGPITVFQLIGIISLFYACIYSVTRHKVPRVAAGWDTRLFFMLYVLVALSGVTKGAGSIANNGSISPLISYTSALLLMLISLVLIDSASRLQMTIYVLMGSYAFASLYVIREWQKGMALYGTVRPGWIVGDSNYFATTAIYAIILALHFVRRSRPGRQRTYCFVCLLLTVIGTTLCASRGGFLGLMAAALYWISTGRNRARNLLLTAAVLIPLNFLVPLSPLHRLIDHNADLGSTDAHLNAWYAGLKMIEAHPLRGVGLGNFKRVMPLYGGPNIQTDNIAHNMFVEVAAELGLPALALFLGIFWTYYRNLGRIRSSGSMPPLLRDAATALQAGLVGIMVGGSFVSAEYEKTTWTGLALASCVIALARSVKRQKATVQAEQTYPARPVNIAFTW